MAAVERASAIARQADVVAALTLDVLKGSCRSYDADIQRLRGQRGQMAVAERMRALLHSETHPSEIAESHRFCNKVQVGYSTKQNKVLCHPSGHPSSCLIVRARRSAWTCTRIERRGEEIHARHREHGEH